MIVWTQKHVWITGIVILVVTNVVALGGVAFNRSGEPEGMLTLTERELGLPYSGGRGRENSGISLAIKWRVLSNVLNEYNSANRWSAVDWLNDKNLDELGFETNEVVLTPESRSRFRSSSSRLVWLVLENDGPAYQEMRDRAAASLVESQALASLNPGNEKIERLSERAKNRRDEERDKASRLFIVDAGLNRSALQKKYLDKTRYTIQRGEIRASVGKNKDDQWIVQGYIRRLSIESVHVPLTFRDIFPPPD